MSRVELQTGALAEARPDPRDVVSAFQRDLLRVAFVLTGEEERSISLADGAFLEILTGDFDEESDALNWSHLLSALGRLYLAGEDTGAATRGALPDDLDQAADERARLRQALDLLDRPMRAALVLRDLGGLNARDAATLAGFEPEEFDAMLEWSRERILEAAGRYASDTPQRLLATLAVDAPRVDLWPDLAPALNALVADQRRRSRRLLILTLALLIAILLAALVWFLGDLPSFGRDDGSASADDNVVTLPTPSSAPTRPPSPTVTPAPTPTSVQLIDAALGSGLQVRAIVRGDFNDIAEERLYAYEPLAGSGPVRQVSHPLRELQPSTYVPYYLSPDGRWTVLSGERQEENVETDDPNDYRSVSVLSAALDGVEQGWEYELPPYSAWDSAVLGDRLYVAAGQDGSPTLVALDLRTGETTGSTALELPVDFQPSQDGYRVSVQLFPFPKAGAPQIYALVAGLKGEGATSAPWLRAIYRVQLDSLQKELIDSDVVEGNNFQFPDMAGLDFYFWGAQLLPDGSGLYQVTHDWSLRQQVVQVLDFESGQVDTIQVPFSPIVIEPTSGGLSFQTVTSNDGRLLYILSEGSGEVAIIDLTARRVERIFPLDPGGLTSGPIDVAWTALSHDGRWLYLIQDVSWQWDRVGPVYDPPKSTPVWIVDLTTWRVAHRVDISGAIDALHLDPDGDEFHVITQVRNPADPERLRFLLMSFDARTWQVLDSIDLSALAPEDAHFQFRSTTDAYRDTYGRAPVVDGIEPGVVEEYTTLPRVRIIARDEGLPVGLTLPVEVEFSDPATGQPITGPDPRVRYEPGQPTMLVFEHPGAKSLITVSAEIAPGQQQGTIRLKVPGIWDARVIVGEGESGFTLVLQGVFRGLPTFEGDDGRPYTLRLETTPIEPIPAGEVHVRATFIDAETGGPIPEYVTLVDGMPEDMDIALTASGSMSRDLANTGHGVYESTIDIAEPGEWRVRLIFYQPEASDSRSVQVEAGILHVVAPDNPALSAIRTAIW